MAHPNLGGLGFRFGKWSIEDGDLLLTIGDTSKLRCKIISLKSNELILHLKGSSLIGG